MPLCTGIEHGPPENPYSRQCLADASYRIVDENMEGFLCARHAKIVRHMYEPGQLTKLRSPRAKEKAK
jgi:hypothetical protein